MSPMTRSRGTLDNRPGPLAATYYAQRASAGLIITEGTQSEWGYSAYFEDSEGNVWELMAQPPAN